MADTRCPMCGKVNPDDREECQYCGARLVPLIIEAPPEEEGERGSGGAAAESAAWERGSGGAREKETGEAGFEEGFSEFEAEGDADWLSELRGEENLPQPPLVRGEENPPQPPLIRGEQSAPQPPLERGEQPQEAGEELDWTAGEGLEEAETPDWLHELQEESGGASEDQAAFEDEAGDEALDWLEQMRQRGEQAQQEEIPEETPDPAVPDWLEQLDEEEEDLKGFGKPFRSEEPDWLSEAAGGPEDLAVSQEIPEWLSEISGPTTPEEAEPESVADEQSVDELASDEIVVPDWLSELENPPQPPLIRGEQSAPQPALEKGEENPPQPPLIRGEQSGPQPPLTRGEETRQPGLERGEENPPQPPLTRGEQSAAEEAEPEISRAEIPSWLASMRPVEDAAPPIAPHEASIPRVESAGPLSGFSGVLSPQPEVGQVPKPPTYSIKLQVSENQKSHADLLTEMLAQEGEAQAIPRPAMISPQHILRSAIALIIMLAVLWPLITGSQEAPLPSFSPGTAAVNQLINGLPDQAQVLLAFDYEPALTGEMEPAASAVVDHLMLRGAYLSLVSTSPLGPIVAERFLSTTQAEHGYASDSQYVNLGFIPGGPAGLLAFAESPGRVLPYTLEGNPAWGRGGQPALPPLQGVTHLSDFDLVMVITDSPEAARTWVEQAQPFLEDESAQTPLVMVTSAQAEPLVRPYYQPTSGQVQGLLSGLRDGGAYGRLTGSEGLTRKYWDAFGLGLWVAAAVITVGGLVNVGLGVGRDRGWGIRDRG